MIPTMMSVFLFRNASADDVDFSVTIDPSLNITIPTNLITLDLNPATNAFASQDLTVSVGTNNPTGYTLTMNSSSTSLTRTEAISGSYPTIATLDAAVAENNFTPNRWGYRFNDSVNTNYQPFTANLPYNSSTEAVDSDAKTITFAAKVNTDQAPGTYELGLDFTAVANPIGPDIPTYMQDFSTMTTADKQALLGNMTEGQAYQIKDNRDEEEYKIAKLADGNVWLLDNLRLDLTSVNLAKLQGNTNADDTTLSYLKTSTSSAPSPYTKYAVSNSWTSSSQDYLDRPMINTSYKDTTTTSYGSGSEKIGVYYNYCAATAGSYCYASGSGSGNALQDICPKGWSLPTGGTDTTANFHALCKAYNNNTACSSSQSMTATNSGSLQYNLSTPLSGYFRSGSPYNQGSNGDFWSSTQGGGDDMYGLRVDSSTVRPQNYNYRGYGRSVRCMLQ